MTLQFTPSIFRLASFSVSYLISHTHMLFKYTDNNARHLRIVHKVPTAGKHKHIRAGRERGILTVHDFIHSIRYCSTYSPLYHHFSLALPPEMKWCFNLSIVSHWHWRAHTTYYKTQCITFTSTFLIVMIHGIKHSMRSHSNHIVGV